MVVLSLLAPLALVLAPAAPAAAATSFAAAVTRAVHSAAPGFALRHATTGLGRSEVGGGGRTVATTVTFVSGRRLIAVQRLVGGLYEATRSATLLDRRVLGRLPVRRPGAGTRPAALTSTVASGTGGLTVLSWSERAGVNYSVVARGGVSGAVLAKIAQALPKDGTTVNAATRSLIAHARPQRLPSTVDAGRTLPAGPTAADRRAAAVDGITLKSGVVALGTDNLTVDGAGAVDDDLGDEGTLCSGCSWSSGNYTGMWQLTLYDDGKLSWGAIDCSFGSKTASATRSWQSREGLSSDGIVGHGTRSTADNYLHGNSYVTYFGLYNDTSYDRSLSSYRYYYSPDGVRLAYSFSPGHIQPCAG